MVKNVNMARPSKFTTPSCFIKDFKKAAFIIFGIDIKNNKKGKFLKTFSIKINRSSHAFEQILEVLFPV